MDSDTSSNIHLTINATNISVLLLVVAVLILFYPLGCLIVIALRYNVSYYTTDMSRKVRYDLGPRISALGHDLKAKIYNIACYMGLQKRGHKDQVGPSS